MLRGKVTRLQGFALQVTGLTQCLLSGNPLVLLKAKHTLGHLTLFFELVKPLQDDLRQSLITLELSRVL